MNSKIKANNVGVHSLFNLSKMTAMLMLALSTGAVNAEPSRSTNIAMTKDETHLINLNQDNQSVTIFKINASGSGADALKKVAEITVGSEPQCVAIKPDSSEAYITTADGSVVVIALAVGDSPFSVLKRITVGAEPRGCALTPTGNVLYVANHTSNTISIINTALRSVVKTVAGFNRPYAVAISDNGDTEDTDETIFVSDFIAELIPGGPGEPFDTGKRGVIRAFPFGNAPFLKKITLSPMTDVGFTADRSALCPLINPSVQSTVYCPDPTGAAGDPDIITAPQGAFPNQLHALLIHNNQLYVPSIGAAPSPPVKFNVNIQALVHVVNPSLLAEIKANTVNLNAQIKTETVPTDPFSSLGKLLGNDIVAVDAKADKFAFVSRGGNYVLRAGLTGGKLNIGAPANVVRLQTGHIPTGIVISNDGSRAYTNNMVGRSVSVLDFTNNTVVAQDIESAPLPLLGSFEHNLLMGKLTFFTALGVPDDGLSKLPIRSINPLQFRGKQSDNAWSSCASCHPAGLADGVTWIFPDGPRQTIPLDSTYSKRSAAHDTRILNWSAVRGSNTDFNNNSKGVQGGTGFAALAAPILNHGITQGASEALDDETLYIQSIRPFQMPPATNVGAGRTVFQDNCASCHGGAKWTKSQILYRENPALVAGAPRDPGVTLAASGGGQIQSFTLDGTTLNYLEKVDTFLDNNSLEIRANGLKALGTDGFNVPSLLGVRFHAPYLHDGSATQLIDVLKKHKLNGGTIANQLSSTQQVNLLKFLNTIDGQTDPIRSEADDFRAP
ncbi:MAG: YncE family protein [Methylococcaceae bacterium]